MPTPQLLHTPDVDVRVQAVSFADSRVGALLDRWSHEAPLPPRAAPDVRPGDFAVPEGTFVLALRGRTPCGCAGVRRLSAEIGEVKRLYVAGDARRQGVARAMLSDLEQRAGRLGFTELRLDTHAEGPANLFRAAGFTPTPAYNHNPLARYWFAKRIESPPRP